MCKSKDCQHGKESPIKDWKHRCKFGPDGKKLQPGTVIAGWNDMHTTHPALAAECLDDSTKYVAGTCKKLNWKCSTCGHEWRAIAQNRSRLSRGCPKCGKDKSAKSRSTAKYKESFAFKFPDITKEHIGVFDLKEVFPKSNKSTAWRCSACLHEWRARFADRTNGRGCPKCERRKSAKLRSTARYEESLAFKFPDITKEHIGDIDLEKTYPKSGMITRWRCARCSNEWSTAIYNRVNGRGCLECGRKRIGAIQSTSPYGESLAYLFPEIAKEYIGDMDLGKIYAKSDKKLQWSCSKCGHKWESAVYTRTTAKGNGCRKCSRKLLADMQSNPPYDKSLFYRFPDLAIEYRGKKEPIFVYANSYSKVGWCCSVCSREWTARVYSRARGSGCPDCGKIKVASSLAKSPYKKSLAFRFPEIASEYCGDLETRSIYANSNKKFPWKCSRCSYKWFATASHRTKDGCGCPKCNVGGGFNPGKPSFFYLLSRPGQLQFGITNSFKIRMKRHSVGKWKLIESAGSIFGSQIYDLELEVKRALRRKGIPTGAKAFREKFEGWTESFQTVDLNCSTIVELIEKLGLDIPDFVKNGKKSRKSIA